MKESHILSQEAFWMVNKKMARLVGVEAALLLSDLITKNDYFKSQNLQLEGGWFFNTATEIEEQTTLSYHKQKQALKKLVEYEFVETKLIGVPAKLHFKIFENQILNFLNTGIEIFLNLYNKNKPNKNKNKNKPNSENEFSVKPSSHIPMGIEKEKIAAKKKKRTDPLFQPFRKLFEDEYTRITGTEYYWNVKDSVAINRLIQKIRYAYKTAKNPVENPTQEQMKNGFAHILKRAAADKWLSANFETTIIDSKFNTLKNIKNGTRIEKDRELFEGVIEGFLREDK